jgi:hypothetical protein
MFARSMTIGALLMACTVLAQEGHPLRGSWIGVWEGNETHGDNVVVILDWDGRQISGIINPGTDNIEIKNATLDPSDWGVRIEADAEGSNGRTLHYVIEGTIRELELPNRQIVGTWRSEAGRGAFEIHRQ